MNTNKHHWFYYSSMTILIIAAVLGLYYFYLLYFPPRVAEFRNFTVQPHIIHASQSLVVRADYCKYIDASSIIIRDFLQEDGERTVIALGSVASTDPVGCGKFVTYIMIPPGLPKGKYVVDLTFEYQANPIRVIYEEYHSPAFELQ